MSGFNVAVARPRTDGHAAHGVHSEFDGNHEDMALVNVWQNWEFSVGTPSSY